MARPAQLKEHHEEIRRLYEVEKMSAGQIAKHYGVSDMTIAWALKRAGVQMRSRKEAVAVRWGHLPVIARSTDAPPPVEKCPGRMMIDIQVHFECGQGGPWRSLETREELKAFHDFLGFYLQLTASAEDERKG